MIIVFPYAFLYSPPVRRGLFSPSSSFSLSHDVRKNVRRDARKNVSEDMLQSFCDVESNPTTSALVLAAVCKDVETGNILQQVCYTLSQMMEWWTCDIATFALKHLSTQHS